MQARQSVIPLMWTIFGATITSVAMENGVKRELEEILLLFGEGLAEPEPEQTFPSCLTIYTGEGRVWEPLC